MILSTRGQRDSSTVEYTVSIKDSYNYQRIKGQQYCSTVHCFYQGFQLLEDRGIVVLQYSTPFISRSLATRGQRDSSTVVQYTVSMKESSYQRIEGQQYCSIVHRFYQGFQLLEERGIVVLQYSTPFLSRILSTRGQRDRSTVVQYTVSIKNSYDYQRIAGQQY